MSRKPLTIAVGADNTGYALKESHNAGMTVDQTVRRMTSQEYGDHVSTVNSPAAFYLSRAILQHMLERGYGRIINISSVIGSARRVRSGELRRRQVRHVRADHEPGPGDRQQAHHHQHGHARVRHHRHDRDHPRRRDGQDRRIPVAGSANPARSRGWWSSSPTPNRRYITARSTRSTATCTYRQVPARAEGWSHGHAGHYRAMRSLRCRRSLTAGRNRGSTSTVSQLAAALPDQGAAAR